MFINIQHKVPVVAFHIRAWYKDEVDEKDQHEPHMLDPAKLLDIKDLEKIGIFYFQVSKLNLHFIRRVSFIFLHISLICKS